MAIDLGELFEHDPVTVARELLGRDLVRVFGSRRDVRGKITEVKAWGEHPTRELQFTEYPSGVISVSQYGKNFMIDIGVNGGAGCVTLVNAFFPDFGRSVGSAGRLAKALEIDTAFTGYDLFQRVSLEGGLDATLRIEGSPYGGTILEKGWSRAPVNWQGTFYFKP
ncbi:hypothetical protein HOE91_02980 [archaeon]|jgi:hypothetical protein|nr:hypothetical protein [archaeon]